MKPWRMLLIAVNIMQPAVNLAIKHVFKDLVVAAGVEQNLPAPPCLLAG